MDPLSTSFLGFPIPSRRAVAASIAVVAVLSVGPSTAEAGSFRCGRRLVALGDSAGYVLSRCGAPLYASTSTEIASVLLAPGEEFSRIVPVEVWTYDRGPHEFVRYLTFRDGVLEDIQATTYGAD